MLKINELKEIIDIIDNSSITEFEFDSDGGKIKIKKQGEVIEQVEKIKQVEQVNKIEHYEQVKQIEPITTTEQKSEDINQITSPMVGTFYKSSSPDAEDYVKVGDKVEEKSIVCIIEAMKMFNEIEAEVKGEIIEVLVKDGQLIEYGQPLFLVK